MKSPKSWPLCRSDVLIVIGVLVMIYTGLNKAWGGFVLGVLLLLVGLLVPRMRGPFSLGGSRFQVQGELVDPAAQPATSSQLQLPVAEPGRSLPLGPPASSQPPTEKRR